MMGQRFVIFKDTFDGSRLETDLAGTPNYYWGVNNVKGATFLDTKTGRVYLVTASTTSDTYFLSQDSHKYVKETVEQFADDEL